MERKCWDCGNIAEHEDSVVPHVLCKKCGSQDTRLTRKKVANNDGLESVAAQIAVAIAGISRDDYRATVDAISGQLERFGISQLQRARN
jgi:DNA-directed RNA polymerase subunit RPC12/RpoP